MIQPHRITLSLGGAKVRYGEPEPWKRVQQKIGRTKPSRAPGYKRRHKLNKKDYRPPDTARALLGPTVHRAKTLTAKSVTSTAQASQSIAHTDKDGMDESILNEQVHASRLNGPGAGA